MTFDVKKTWDACGGAFDRFTTAEDSHSYNIERPMVERLAGEVRGQRVLELGCGSGVYSVWFAERGATVTGLDLSEVMIELARNRARAHTVEADLRVGDISKSLPFPDAEFDLVFTATVLHYVRDLAGVMKEAARVIKPGGRLVASVLHPISTALFPVAEIGDETRPQPVGIRYFGAPLREIETPWLDFGEVSGEGQRIISYHHTVSDYFTATCAAGLTVTDLCEPAPTTEFARKNPARYEEAMRSPVYLIFKATR
jgi:SAM-dependent methyltransferase